MFCIINKKIKVAVYDEKKKILEINGKLQELTECQHEYLEFALEKFSLKESYKPEDFKKSCNIDYLSSAISRTKSQLKKKFGNIDIFGGTTKIIELNSDYTVVKSNYTPDSFAIEDITLYEQNITEIDSGGNKIIIGKNTDIDSLKNRLKNDTFCICGGAGIGKTELLKRIYISLKSYGSIAYIISLPALLKNALNNHIQDSKLTYDVAVNGGYNNLEDCYNSYIMQFINNISEFGIKEQTFFLLDGMNELLEQRKPGTFIIIERILHEIESICQSEKTIVIITSRSFKTTAEQLKDIKLKQWTPEPLNKNIPDSAFSPDMPENNRKQILEWLKRPLFYHMYMQMLKDEKSDSKNSIPSTQYGFLKKFYLFFYRQTINNKNYIDETEPMALFFFILPFVACTMQKNRDKFLSEKELREVIIDSLPESHREKSLITSVINKVQYEMSGNPNSINGISDNQAEKYIEMLNNLDIVSFSTEEDSIKFGFSHDIWSEFLCSFYIINYIQKIEDVTNCSKYIPSFNLKSDIQEIIMCELNIQPITENMIKDNPDKVEKIQDNFRKLFTTSNKMTPDTIKSKRISGYLNNELDILYIAFEMSDNFRLHTINAFGELAEGFILYLIKLSDKNNISNIFDSEHKCFLLKILSAMFQFYREMQDKNPDRSYSMCHTLYSFAVEQLKFDSFRNSNGKEYLAYCLLRHAYAKALLFEGYNLISKNIHKKEGTEKFNEALNILEQNKTFNMSANLLGCIYATPIKFLLENNLIKPDITKSFDIYNSSYREMTGKNGEIFTLTGTELIYTCRQLLGFILKGYVQIINTPDGEKAAENVNKNIPDKNSLNFCKKIMEDIEGQYITFVDWLRGVYKAYTGGTSEYKNILRLFEKEDSNYMTMIVKLSNIAALRNEYITFSDSRISAEGRKLLKLLDDKISNDIKNIGLQKSPDQTDKYYMLRDAVTLIDVLENISKEDDTIICDEIKKIRTKIVSSKNYIEFENLQNFS